MKDDDFAGQLAGFLTALVVLGAIILFRELARIYVLHALKRTPVAFLLWGALAGVVTAYMLAASLPSTVAGTVTSWAFLLFVVIVEACDVWEQYRGRGDSGEDELTYGETIG